MGDFHGRKCFFQRRKNIEAQGKDAPSWRFSFQPFQNVVSDTSKIRISRSRGLTICVLTIPPALHYRTHYISQRKIQHSFFAHIKKKNYLCRKLAGIGSCPIVYSPIQPAQSTDFQKHLPQKKFPPHSFCNNTTIINNKLKLLTQ